MTCECVGEDVCLFVRTCQSLSQHVGTFILRAQLRKQQITMLSHRHDVVCRMTMSDHICRTVFVVSGVSLPRQVRRRRNVFDYGLRHLNTFGGPCGAMCKTYAPCAKGRHVGLGSELRISVEGNANRVQGAEWHTTRMVKDIGRVESTYLCPRPFSWCVPLCHLHSIRFSIDGAS